MKKTLSLLGLPLLIGALALPVMAQEAPAIGAPVAVPETGKHKGESHHFIKESITRLEVVRVILTKDAAHDFAGHKQKAIEAIDGALKELHECLVVVGDTK